MSSAMCVARTSGVGVGVAARGVGVGVGVTRVTRPFCTAKTIQLRPISRKNATRMLMVRMVEVRLRCGGG